MHMTTIRRPKDADTPQDLWQYYDTRSRQLLHAGFTWDGVIDWAPSFEGKAIRAFYHSEKGVRHVSFFVLPGARGQGVMRSLATAAQDPIVTVHDCDLAPILDRVGAAYHLAGNGVLDSVEYELIQAFYGDTKAKRSQVFLMNHIDEGIAVMCWLGYSAQMARAFCLHPLVQNDSDLKLNFESVCSALEHKHAGTTTLALAMEYRAVANEYLAHCAMGVGGIRLSPLEGVKAMLLGDKVQNRKDFELHHAGTHANRRRLGEYFAQWCEALGISDAQYAQLTARLPGARTPQTEVAATRS